MNSVWSFWSKPYFADQRNRWLSDAHHWFSWVMSLEAAKKHYPSTKLVTDSRGAEIIVERLVLRQVFKDRLIPALRKPCE